MAREHALIEVLITNISVPFDVMPSFQTWALQLSFGSLACESNETLCIEELSIDLLKMLELSFTNV